MPTKAVTFLTSGHVTGTFFDDLREGTLASPRRSTGNQDQSSPVELTTLTTRRFLF